MASAFVTPAKAGVPLPSRQWRGIPAFAGMTRWLVALLAGMMVFGLAAPAAAQNFPEHHGSPVVDEAALLRPEQVVDLKSKSEALYARTGRSFVVATVKSLNGLTIEDYGYQLGRHWKLGDKAKDDAVILIVAPKERKVRIETGYGAEGFLPDIMTGRIIRDAIIPHFKKKPPDYGAGIMAGSDAIIQQMSISDAAADERITSVERQERGRKSSVGFVPVIFWVIVLLFVISTMARAATRGSRRYRRRRGGVDPWVVLWGLNELSRASRGSGGWGGGSWGGGGGVFGGGGGGGGFGGFGGGGSFGGGGASGSW